MRVSYQTECHLGASLTFLNTKELQQGALRTAKLQNKGWSVVRARNAALMDKKKLLKESRRKCWCISKSTLLTWFDWGPHCMGRGNISSIDAP